MMPIVNPVGVTMSAIKLAFCRIAHILYEPDVLHSGVFVHENDGVVAVCEARHPEWSRGVNVDAPEFLRCLCLGSFGTANR